jgi:hypothetical protein
MTLNASQRQARAAAVEEVRAFMRGCRLKPTDLIELGGEDQRADNAPDLRRRAFAVERTWALMAGLGIRHSDLEEAFPHEFCPAAVSAADLGSRRRRSKTQVVDFIEEPDINSEVNSSMISMGAKTESPPKGADFGVANAPDPEIAAANMKARFAAMDDAETAA